MIANAQTEEMWQKTENEAAGGRYKEAFERLRGIEQVISSNSKLGAKGKSAQRYRASLIRMKMYMRMRRSESAMEHLEKMERHANASGDEKVLNDLLYNKAIYYYTFGQTEKGNGGRETSRFSIIRRRMAEPFFTSWEKRKGTRPS